MKEQQDVLVREARERHRAQAAQVFISLDDDRRNHARFNVTNTSDQPVYDAEIRWRDDSLLKPAIHHTQVGTILPGDRPSVDPALKSSLARPRTDDDRFTVLMFRDAAGVMWTRKLDGDLSELGTQGPRREILNEE